MRRRYGRLGLLALAAVALLLGGCSGGARRPGKLRVVAKPCERVARECGTTRYLIRIPF